MAPAIATGADANLGTHPTVNFVAWTDIDVRFAINKQLEFGAVYEFALTIKQDDIMDTRRTVDFNARRYQRVHSDRLQSFITLTQIHQRLTRNDFY